MKPNSNKPMTVQLPEDLAGQIDQLALATGRNKNAITVSALRDYVEAHVWQIEDTEQGVAEADRGEFASDSEVNAAFAKYGA